MTRAAVLTMEVRWFVRGTLPDDISRWFGRPDPAPQREPPRCDCYLLWPTLGESQRPAVAPVGIKVRGSKVEHKVLQRIVCDRTFARGISGRVEVWRKWSFDLATGDPVPGAALSDDPGWVIVSKERWLRTYAVVSQRATAVPAEHWPAEGCTVEVTRLGVRDQAWWSLGLAAFGADTQLATTLHLVAAAVFGGGDAPTLRAAASFGYPEWLARLA